MDAQNFYLKPFQTIGFSLDDVELAGTHFTITVQPGWTKMLVNGIPQTGPVQMPRTQKAVKLEFLR